jgi:hypothetical protein
MTSTMGTAGHVMLAVFLIGALASWIVGAVAYARALPAMGHRARQPAQWPLLIGWPFALPRLRQAAAAEALTASRAMIVFIICITAAVTTISLSTNLTRIAK